jgi:membrane-associated phospholipid phosphatase
MLESLQNIDYAVFDGINQGLSNPFFDTLMPIIRNKKTWFPFYVLLALYLWRSKNKQALLIIAFGVVSISLSDVISSHFLKEYFGRTRPCNLVGFAEHVNLVLEQCSGAYSFPSSHASNHFALAVFLSLVLRKTYASIGFLLWAGSIAFAQVYVGVHFPSDVIAGAIFGSVLAFVVYCIYKRVDKVVAFK